MDISNEQRQAFLAVCKHGSITLAAKKLHLTQAALSIRLKKLEDTLSCSLFVRSRTGVVLTEAAHRFMEYATTIEQWEQTWWSEYQNETKGLTGEVRIGAFSTVGRSLVLPALSGMLRENPEIHFQSFIKELRELPPLLLNGEADFILLDRPLLKDRIESVLLGHEEYVYVKSRNHESNERTFLNHDESDDMSFRWFNAVGKKNVIEKRRYLDEIYSVIDGVAMGAGVSVLPHHLVENDERIQVMYKTQKLLSPVYLNYHKKGHYPKAFTAAREHMIKHLKANLRP